MKPLEEYSAVELGALVNAKVVSPVEVIKYFQERIEKRNPSLNAFTYTRFEEALKVAQHQENLIMGGVSPGLLAGVPVGLKDFLDSKVGWTNSHGGVKSLIRKDLYNSMFWNAASKLGCIAVGKTNAPAFGFSGACENALYGATHTPFDLNRTSGGSSGGSAAAVADGLLLLAESGDAGGSTRLPAGWCNLFGFKASLGTIPSVCRPDAWTATHPYCFNGCEAKTVYDSALMLNYMTEYNPRDPISLPINASKDFTQLMNKPVKGMKIGFTYDFDLHPHVDPEIRDLLDIALTSLDSADVHIEPVGFNFKHTIEEIMYCWATSISFDTALDLKIWKEQGLDLIKDHRDELPEDFIWFNDIASDIDYVDIRKFNEIRTDILDNFEDAFEKYDFIISPTAICKPMPNAWHGKCLEVNGHKLDNSLSFISFGETPMVNFIGYPSASVPMGLTEDKLPIGMQIIGKQYHDEDVLALSHAFEQIKPWYDNYKYALNRKIEVVS